MITFDYKHSDESLTIVKSFYQGGRTALLVVGKDTGEQWITLSVNIPEVTLGDDEFCIKTWSENEELAALVLSLGIFEDTGKRIPTGYVQAQIWKVKDAERYSQIRNA